MKAEFLFETEEEQSRREQKEFLGFADKILERRKIRLAKAEKENFYEQ